ncbi:MAG TPA: MFS transporter [Burkholderiales bacterium]|nr:MFS transporter [Burkholderiales bacterium]
MSNKTSTGVGIYFAALQFVFALCWTVYVIYLPALAARAGIPASAVIWILMLDQAIFALMDVGMGVAADRLAAAYARLARIVLAVTLASCAAFLLLPFASAAGWGAAPFVLLIVLWSATSSALRAPPLVLIGRYAALPGQPWLASLYLFGLGVAGAVAPFLTVRLRALDPAVPFAAASLSLAAVTLGLAWAARNLARHASAPVEARAHGQGARAAGGGGRADVAVFLIGALLAAFGFQLHSALNSAPAYLRFAKPADLEQLLPLFWVGFNLAIFPASGLARRTGSVTVLAAASTVGALALWLAARSPSLPALMAAQVAAGAAWSAVLMSAIAAALALGHTGREGMVNGGFFGLLAVATFARMGMVAAQLHQSAAVSPLLPTLAVLAWAGAALAFIATWRVVRHGGPSAAKVALIGQR